VTDNQDWSVESVKLSVPVPVFVTLRFEAAGFVPPCVAEKLRVEGEIARTGAAVTADT
jgi:hypothetical protein